MILMAEYIDINTAYDIPTLTDWYINSVTDAVPVWTEEHLEELMNDFYLIPKDEPTVDIVRCEDCKYSRNMPLGLCYLHTEPYSNAQGYKGEAVCVEPDDFCSYGERKDDNGSF